MRATFEKLGRLWLRDALDAGTLDALSQASASNSSAGKRLTASAALRAALEPVTKALAPLQPNAFVTRVVAFNKTPSRNWAVPWHQDRVICVADKADHPGYTNWSQKAGTWHCEPPLSVLQGMLFVRVHLDDETSKSGPMQIALGSHQLGKVPAPDCAAKANSHQIETAIGKRGDVLVLKMLTLHCPCPAKTATSRRVLRVDTAHTALPTPLVWAT